jgi:hypothetical protein
MILSTNTTITDPISADIITDPGPRKALGEVRLNIGFGATVYLSKANAEALLLDLQAVLMGLDEETPVCPHCAAEGGPE